MQVLHFRIWGDLLSNPTNVSVFENGEMYRINLPIDQVPTVITDRKKHWTNK